MDFSANETYIQPNTKGVTVTRDERCKMAEVNGFRRIVRWTQRAYSPDTKVRSELGKNTHTVSGKVSHDRDNGGRRRGEHHETSKTEATFKILRPNTRYKTLWALCITVYVNSATTKRSSDESLRPVQSERWLGMIGITVKTVPASLRPRGPMILSSQF